MRLSPQAKDVPELAEYLLDVPKAIDDELKQGRTVLLEGTQGFGISLYYGTYPFVTSKDTSASQIAADNGVGPTKIDDVIVVFKAYPTRVGEGPFRYRDDGRKIRFNGNPGIWNRDPPEEAYWRLGWGNGPVFSDGQWMYPGRNHRYRSR